MHNAEIINKQSNSSHLNNMAQLGLGYTRTQAGFKTPISAVTGFSMSGAGSGLWRGSPSHPTSKLLWAEWYKAAGLIWEQTAVINAIRCRFVCLLCTTSVLTTHAVSTETPPAADWGHHTTEMAWGKLLCTPYLDMAAYRYLSSMSSSLFLSSCCICSQEHSVPMPCLHQPAAKPQQCSRTTRRLQKLHISSRCFLSCGTELDSSTINVGTTFIALFISGNVQNLLLSSYQA